ncbi:MAG: chemotaxis protein CheC [Oscillospiraceae bacterium]|nr:chemotaxis protein CheC [Oscillospiraceae bacterium]
MVISEYDQLDSFHLDVFKELGSIGSGNAATALSSLLEQRITMMVPQVIILENNAAVARLGGPEKIVAAVLVTFTGGINGLILSLQSLEYINAILSNVRGKTVAGFSDLDEIDVSALCEIGNILMSSYISAISRMTGMKIELSPPAISVNMLGAIMSVPMTEFGYEADKLMLIDGTVMFDNKLVESNLIMMPDISSLNKILRLLGVQGE